MLSKSILISLMLFCACQVRAQNTSDVNWFSIEGTEVAESGKFAMDEKDGAVILFGKESEIFKSSWVQMSKFNLSSKEVEFQKFIYTAGNASCTSVIPLDNGTFIIGGFSTCGVGDNYQTHINNGGTNDIFISQIDSIGKTIWYRCLGSSSDEYGNVQVHRNKFGELFVVGTTSDGPTDGDFTFTYGKHDTWILKLDSLGKVLWETVVGSSESDFCVASTIIQDTSLLVITGPGLNDGVFVSWQGEPGYMCNIINGDGQVTDTFNLESKVVMSIVSVYENSTGFFILGDGYPIDSIGTYGYHQEPGNPGYSRDAFIANYTYEGQMEYCMFYGGTKEELITSSRKLENGGFILCGSTSSFDGDLAGRRTYDNDGWIIRLDTVLNRCYQAIFGWWGDEVINSVGLKEDGGYVFYGTNYSSYWPRYHGDEAWPSWVPDYLIGEIGSEKTGLKQTYSSQLELFPNPASSVVYILNNHFEGDYILEIRNVEGQIVKSVDGRAYLNSRIELSTENLRSGLYFVQIQEKSSSNKCYFAKLMVNHN